jgi:hypothetical protein
VTLQGNIRVVAGVLTLLKNQLRSRQAVCEQLADKHWVWRQLLEHDHVSGRPFQRADEHLEDEGGHVSVHRRGTLLGSRTETAPSHSIRTGFSTHAMNMGQRHVELRTSFTVAEDGSAVLHVSPLPGNPAVLGECGYPDRPLKVPT